MSQLFSGKDNVNICHEAELKRLFLIILIFIYKILTHSVPVILVTEHLVYLKFTVLVQHSQ